MKQQNFLVPFLGIFLITFLLNSCHFDTKENYLKDFSNFIVDMETNYQKFTKEDWNAKEIEFKKFIGERYEQFRSQLTEEEQQTIGKLKARYFKIVFKSGLDQLENDIREGAEQLEGFMEEMVDTSSN